VARQRTSGETSAEINLVQDVRRSRTNPVTLVVRVKRTANVRENLLDDAQEPHRIVVVEAADGLPHSAGKTGSERPEGSRPRIQGSRDTHTHTSEHLHNIEIALEDDCFKSLLCFTFAMERVVLLDVSVLHTKCALATRGSRCCERS
jgi:hypothetical protein